MLVQQGLRAGLVHLGAEDELARLAATEASPFAADRPAGDDLGERRDILLRVATIDAERVQLQNLARQILVEAHLAPTLTAREQSRGPRVRTDGKVIVQVEQHRGMVLDRQ